MKKKTFILTALALMAGSLCYSAENLEMKVKAVYNAADEELRVAIVLVNNTEEEIVVLTKPDSKILGRASDGTLLVQAGFGGVKKMFGHELVPSLSPYHPVTLNSGEATGFLLEVSPKTIEIEKEETVRIQYSIGENLSERYDLWPSPVKERTDLVFR